MPNNSETSSGWKIISYDTFSDEECPIGVFSGEDLALQAATKKFQEIESIQPSDMSGGQAEDGIQDRLFIQRPDGTRYRFLPPELRGET